MRDLRIKDICSKGSSSLKQKDVENHAGKYPVYGASGIVGYRDRYDQEKPYIGLVKDGSGIGRVMFLPEKSSIIGTLQYILPRPGFDINYIGYCLLSLGLSSYKQGAAIPHIYFRDYGERIIRVEESIEAQQKIVDHLNMAFAKVDALCENASKARIEAMQCYLTAIDTFLAPSASWKHYQMTDICEITSSLVNPMEHKYQQLIHVGGANIVSQTGELINLKTAQEEGLISGKYLFDDTMVIYSKLRPNLMKVARPDFVGLCSADMYPLKPKKVITKDYLYYLLLTGRFTSFAVKGSSRAGMPKVNRDYLFSYSDYLPPINVQKEIVEKLDSVQQKCFELEDNYKQVNEECSVLKQSILRDYFE